MTSTIPVARASLVQAVLSQRCPGLSIPGSFGRTTHSASVLPLFILLPLTDKNLTWKDRMRESPLYIKASPPKPLSHLAISSWKASSTAFRANWPSVLDTATWGKT